MWWCACMLWDFEKIGCVFLDIKDFKKKGHNLTKKQINYHQIQVHWKMPWNRYRCEYSVITFPCFLSNSVRTICSKKKKWHTFSGFGPTSLSYNAKAASYLLNLGSKPCNNIKNYIGRETTNFWKKNNKNNNDTCKICHEILTKLNLNTASFVYLKGPRSTYFSLQLPLELLLPPVQDIFIPLKFFSHVLPCGKLKRKWYH